MPYNSIIYIDESGCDGIENFRPVGVSGGTSHWLTIACAVVSRQNDTNMPTWRNEILASFPRKKRRDLHFADLKHDQRIHACNMISKLPLSAVAVASNKTTIPEHPRADLFRKKNTLYWYLTRYLIERASKHVYRSGLSPAKVIFSRRGGMNYDDFQRYLRKLKHQQEVEGKPSYINWNAIDIDLVEAIDHKNRAGLQIADGFAHSVQAAIEPNQFGNFEPRYCEILMPKFIAATNGHPLTVGIKPVPQLDRMTLDPWQQYFFDRCAGKNVRPPGPCTIAAQATATSR